MGERQESAANGSGGDVELDYRISGEIEVTLLWNKLTNLLHVQFVDWQTDETGDIPATPENSMDVFNHPYAYIGRTAVQAAA